MTEPGIPLDYDSWHGSEEEHLSRPLPENPLGEPFTKKKLKQCLALYEDAKEGIVHDVLYTAMARVEFPRALAALEEARNTLKNVRIVVGQAVRNLRKAGGDASRSDDLAGNLSILEMLVQQASTRR